MKRIMIFFTITLLLVQAEYGASRNPVHAKNGMVVSATKWASEAGVEILKKGGNAVDAAVATGFALAVTYPQAGNIGGGGFMVIRTAAGENLTLDYREMAPSKAHRDMYLNDDGNVVENLSLYGHLAAGVPGSVDGLLKAARDHGSGTLSRRFLLAPAIRLAKRGFPITRGYANMLNNRHDFFARDDGAKEIFIRKDGHPWQAGDLLIQKDLARTLERIASRGRAGFYEGQVAALIEREMIEGDGIITHADLINYQSIYRSPVIGTFWDYEIVSMGPPSSGGLMVIQMLNMLENFSLDTLGWNSSEYIHLLTEVERRAFADRAEHMGDPDFWPVPLDILSSKDYAQDRIQTISMEHATPSTEVYAGNPEGYESQETTHYSVVDKDGNAVGVTTTLNTSFGCGVVVEGAGFFLNNEMDDFSAKPGIPNLFGLVGQEANAVQPGKRPLSSMTPTIVLKAGNPTMVIGSPGGATIITTVLQVILNVTVHGMDIQEAVAAPRVHSQWLPDAIMAEVRSISRDVERNLRARGHTVIPYRWNYIGRANGIVIGDDGLYGGPDTRGENSAVGY